MNKVHFFTRDTEKDRRKKRHAERNFPAYVENLSNHLNHLFGEERHGIKIESDINKAEYICLIAKLDDTEILDSFDKNKIIGVGTEPSWIRQGQTKQEVIDRCGVFLSWNSHKYENGLFSTNMHYPPMISQNIDYNLDLIKERPLSMFISMKPYRDNNGGYGLRKEVVKAILSSNIDCDIYGNHGLKIKDSRLKGFVRDKRTGLNDYRFSVVIESFNEFGYISEKPVDSFLCDTMPIYWGTDYFYHIFGKNMIRLNTSKVIEQLLNISKNSKIIYENCYPSIQRAKLLYRKEHNLLARVEMAIKLLESGI